MDSSLTSRNRLWNCSLKYRKNKGLIRVGIANDRWSVAGFVENFTDEEFLEEIIPAPEFGGSFDHPGSQRRGGLEVTFNL